MAAPGRGHYESYFVEAVAPGGGRGLWLRFTAERQPGGPTTGALWAAYVDGPDESVVAVRCAGLPLHTGNGAWIRCGVSTFSPDGTQGSVEIDGHALSWDVAFASMEQPLRHLPRPWMYAARLPRTKLLSPLPAATVSGRLTVDGRTVDVDRWRGAVGHNWGEQHAQSWLWLNAIVAEGAYSGSWLDLAVARIRVGGVPVPWTAFGAISLEGHRIQLGGLGRRVSVTASELACSLVVPGRGATVTVEASSPPASCVRWDYLDPSGTRHPVSNSPVADLRLTLARSGQLPVELQLSSSAIYEYGHTA